MKIAITAPTGNIGRKLVAKLQAGTDHELILLARDPEKLTLETSRGAKVQPGDLNDSAYVTEATQGVDALFWLIPPDFAQENFRAYQNHIARTGADAVRANQIKHTVLLSSVGAQHREGTGPVVGLHDAEETFEAATPHLTILRPTYFMENYLFQLDAIRGSQAVSLAVPGDQRIAMIATVDIATTAAEVLAAAPPSGARVLELLGPTEYRFDEAASVIGEAIGKPVKHVQVTPARMREALRGLGASRDVAGRLVELESAIASGLMRPEFPRGAEQTTPTTFADFAKTVLAPALAASGMA
ncbi:MAG: NAD(P)H-binding protein [Gammaproteobacteria bacterium]